MRIAVIGASHGIGLDTVKTALGRGYNVNALSRSGIGIRTGALNDIKGSALNLEDLSNAIGNADAIIVTLGTRGRIKSTTLFSDFAKTLLRLHETKPIAVPVIILTGFGTADTMKYQHWYAKIPLRLVLGRVYDDKSIMESLISSSSLKWEIVRPWFMSNGKSTRRYRAETVDFSHYSLLPVSRFDVADFMVRQAEVPTEIGKEVAIFKR